MSNSHPHPDSPEPGSGSRIEARTVRRKNTGPLGVRSWWFRYVAGAFLLLAVAGVVAGPRGYRELKRFRALGMGRTATGLMAAGDLEHAAPLVHTALHLAPKDPEVSRVVARFCAAARIPEGVKYWSTALESPNATREEFLEATAFAILVGRVELSDGWLTQLSARYPRDPAVRRMMIRQLERIENRAGAVAMARAVLADQPTDPESEYALGNLLIGEPSPVDREEGRRLLRGVAAGSSVDREIALSALIACEELPRSELEMLARTIDAQTNAPAAIRLQVIDLRLRLDPDSRAARLREAVGLATAMGPELDLGRVAAWLNRNGGSSNAMELLEPGRCRTNARLMGERLKAMLALNRTNEMGRWVAEGTGHRGGPLLAAARGSLLAHEGRKAEAESAFREALLTGRKTRDVMPFVAAAAEAAGFPSMAIEAYQTLLESPGWSFDAARSILRLGRPMADMSAARIAVDRLNAIMPNDEAVAGERAWIESIFDEHSLWAKATFERLARAHPRQPYWRFGCALATLRHGDKAGALALVEESGIPWETLEPRMQMAYVAVLGANNRRDVARRYAQLISLEQLRTQERALVVPWL